VSRDINQDSSAKSTPVGGESPKVDKPASPQAKKAAPDSSKPSSPKGAQGSPGVGGALTSPTRAATDQDPADASSVPRPTEHPERLPQAPSLMDLEMPMDLNMVKARLCHSLRRFCDSVHGSQSPYGTTWISSRSDFMSVSL
jgi:hypothetical protein